VSDTGFDINHPEFNGRISPLLYNFGNDQATDILFPAHRNDGSLNGHGVHVAATIGAGRRGFGMQGVAYDAMIMPLRGVEVDGRQDGILPVNEAIVHAADNGAQVLNGSYGPNAFPPPRIDGQPNPNYEVLDYQLIVSHPSFLEQTYEAL